MQAVKQTSIGVILGSTRNPRASPQIAAYVVDAIQQLQKDLPSSETHLTQDTTYKILDLADFNLPILDEPLMASQVKDPANYTHEHTRVWSREISSHDGLIFVTPQYNWSLPAVLKNSIDYLYHEWSGKPCMVVTYGGRGGGQAALELKKVLGGGVHAKVAETMPALKYPDRTALLHATEGGKLDLGRGEGAIWAEEREVVRKAFEELRELVGASAEGTL